MTDDQMSPEASSDDKLLTALGWVLSPLVPIVLLLLEDKKDRPFIRVHSVTAIAWSVVYVILSVVLTATVILACTIPFIYFIQWYWAYQAYQGQVVNIPFVTDFVKNQGWV